MVDFTTTTASPDKYKALFGCEIKYNCDVVKIAIPMSLLEKESPHYSPELFQKYLEFCQLESPYSDRSTSLGIRAANVIKKSPSLDWSLELAAQKLNISVSTLKRKLRAEGVSFKIYCLKHVLKGFLLKIYCLKHVLNSPNSG